MPPCGVPSVGLAFFTELGSQTLPQSSSTSVSTPVGVQTGVRGGAEDC